MRRKLLDRLFGDGRVYRKDGVFVGLVHYELRVYQNYIDARTKDDAATPLGPKQVEGHMTGLDNHALWAAGTLLTLHLQDGRRLDFRIKDVGGGIASKSGLYEAA